MKTGQPSDVRILMVRMNRRTFIIWLDKLKIKIVYNY